jgi:hypothetical protein
MSYSLGFTLCRAHKVMTLCITLTFYHQTDPAQQKINPEQQGEFDGWIVPSGALSGASADHPRCESGAYIGVGLSCSQT